MALSALFPSRVLARPSALVRGLLVALGVVLAAAAARAQTFTLIDTFGSGNTFTSAGTVGGSASIVNAVRVTVPAGNNVSLLSVDMALAIGGSVSTMQVGVFNDSGGLPVGMPIVFANFTGPFSGTLAFSSAPFAVAFPLTAGHSYWFAPIMTGTGSVDWASGLNGSTTVAFFSGSTWAAETTPHPLSLRVTVSSVSYACCNARGTGGCIVLSQADCATVGGVSDTNILTCASNLCGAIIPGACCRGALCTATTSVGCVAVSPSGRFLGAGVSCTPVPAGGPNPCCAADFDDSGAITVQDIFDFLQAWFAGCP